MRHKRVIQVAVLLALLAQGCLAQPEEERTATEQPLPVAIDTVQAVRVHPGGGEPAYTPGQEAARAIARALLGIFAELNLQALCMILDEDVARLQQEDGALELVFAHPVDVATGQRIGTSDQVPVDERGYRVLHVERAVFVLAGEMAGHVLVAARAGEWSCWAVEEGGAIDLGWVARIEPTIPPRP
ncbi:MAG: hypothetical protein JXA09_06670 [Anaerolineae bacterium]|nr:hypothetical protein [Anaerolineae bacterium]